MKHLVVWFALLLYVTPCLAQDAMVLTPDGPQPWMRIPAPGGPGGMDLWVPMAPRQPMYTPPAVDDRYDSTMEQLRDTQRAVEQFHREQAERQQRLHDAANQWPR